MKNNEFIAYYQPKVDVITKKIVGAEALARWLSQGRIISPAVFIPVAESNFFIKNIDFFIFELVAKKQRELLDKGIKIVPISVNMSKESLYDPKLIEKCQQILIKYRISPSDISLEITENTAFNHSGNVQAIINSLREFGFVILLDDFGAGYSSLNVLSNAKIDVLKIDKAFIDNYNTEKGYSMIKGVVDIAKSLEMVTVAEGVETEEQYKVMKHIGCDEIQGYYFYKPLNEKDYEDALYESQMNKIE